FKSIYEDLSDSVYSLAIHFLKDTGWSEEIVQEVFLRLWVNREKLDEDGNMWLYLYVLTKRLCLNRLRDIRRSNESIEQLMMKIEKVSVSTQNEIFSADLEQYVDKAIALLPERQKVIFRLSRLEGLSHKEIADELGVSPNTVKNHIVEALKTLKKSLHKSDYLYFLAFSFYLSAFL